MRTALNGTPYGFERADRRQRANVGDGHQVHRRLAQQRRHRRLGTVGVPAAVPVVDRPGLGHRGHPGLELVGVAENSTVGCGGGWSPALAPPLPGMGGLAVTLAGFASYDLPPKAFEVIALVVLHPVGDRDVRLRRVAPAVVPGRPPG